MAEASRPAPLATAQLILLGTVAFAAAGQGGFYLGPRVVIVAAIAVAGAIHLGRPHQVSPLRQPFCLSVAALSTWVFADAVVAHHPVSSLPTVSSLAIFAMATMIVSAATGPQRLRLAQATIAVGACLALSGWIGVTFRVARWASPESGLWRATTAVTYTNAAAAVMAALALLALAMLVHRSTAGGRVAAMLLVVGVGATLSRAGIVGLVVGYVVLLGLLGVRCVVATTWRPLAGAFLAAVALTRGMAVASSGRPAIAIVGLLVGGALAAAPPLSRRARPVNRRGRLALAAVAVAILGSVIALAAAGHLPSTASPAKGGWGERITASSRSRANETRAAAALVRAHPLAGTGPGQATFFWVTPDRKLVVDDYAHDEYLQFTAEDGLIGAALLLVLLLTVTRRVTAGRRVLAAADEGQLAVWAGSAAALIYLAGHSGFDFLWHVPVVMLAAGLMVGLCSPPPLDLVPSTTTQPQQMESI